MAKTPGLVHVDSHDEWAFKAARDVTVVQMQMAAQMAQDAGWSSPSEAVKIAILQAFATNFSGLVVAMHSEAD